MSTPTDQQQIRASLRRHAKNEGDLHAAELALRCAVDIIGRESVRGMAEGMLDLAPVEIVQEVVDAALETVPPLMGTAEVAAAFGIANSNISKLPEAVRPSPVARISNGTTPVYLASEVTEKAAKYRPRTRA